MSQDWPETRDELIARFCDPDPRVPDWVPPVTDRELFTRFVDLALQHPDPTFRYASEEPISISSLCNRIYDRSLMTNPHTGWIDRDGKFWGCAYAGHEYLLEMMGMNSIEQEQAGWIKLSRYHAHGVYAANEAQAATLLRIYDNVEERLAIQLNLAGLNGKPEMKERRG